MQKIHPVNIKLKEQIIQHMNGKLKPIGSLGMLEDIALKLALMGEGKINIKNPAIVIFAADHGIANQGVSIAPSEVTGLLLQAIADKKSGVSALLKDKDYALYTVDAGTIGKEKSVSFQARVALGSGDISTEPAMMLEQVQACLQKGGQIAQTLINQGHNILAFGEVGIGNTSAAACIYARLLDKPIEDCTGYGSGITKEQYKQKVELLQKALSRNNTQSPYEVMSHFGGYEINQIVGAILMAASQKKPIVIDGYITGASALLAIKIDKNVKDYLLFADVAAENGHALLFEALDVQPILNLGLRLGEATAAVLALSVIEAAASMYNNMGSFADYGLQL
ncbi:MAG: nicotinate-nucleotide--dimethylbenzimidazole phosphoribosyltransferase [Alphaproteobacteria bacterium]